MEEEPRAANLTARIAELPNAQAARVLALVLAQDRRIADPLAWRQTEPRLREAASDSELRAQFADRAATIPTEAELARAALAYLADTQVRAAPPLDSPRY